MVMSISKTEERVVPEKFESKEEYLVYLRHLFAYELAKDKISKNSIVLELGCGEGYGTNLLSQNVGKIVGLDIERSVILGASEKYKSRNCIFQLYDGVRIPYQDSTFDAVISFQVIEHVQDDISYVSEIYRVLKRNGLLMLTTPNKTYRLRPGQNPWNRFHIREYYSHELENILKTKFSDVKLWGIRGNKEVEGIERQRVKQPARIISFLRKVMPEPLEIVIIRVLKRIARRKQKSQNGEDFLSKYGLRDYYVIQDNVVDSLDLLGICRK